MSPPKDTGKSVVNGIAKVPKRIIKLSQRDSNPGPPGRHSNALTHSATATERVRALALVINYQEITGSI